MMWVSGSRVVALALFCLPFTIHAQDDEMALRVEEALHTSKGNQRELLTALGPEAVPALCEQLFIHDFPSSLIDVLAVHQDNYAVPFLLELLEQDNVLSDNIIKALKEIGDPRAEESLLAIVNDESILIGTRYEATMALARLGSPEVKAWAWEEIMNIYKTGEGVSHSHYLDHNVILEKDVAIGLCEVLTEEADNAIAFELRFKQNVGSLGARTATRNRKEVINTFLHLAEHEDREDDSYIGRFEDYFSNLQSLSFLHGQAVVPTQNLLDIMAKLEKRFPELAVPIEGEDTSLYQAITGFQELKKSILDAPVVTGYLHPPTRTDTLYHYLWCHVFKYATIPEYVATNDRLTLHSLLKSAEHKNAWRHIPMVLSTLGEDMDSFEALKHYIQRPEALGRSRDLGHNLFVYDKPRSVKWLPFLDNEKGCAILLELLVNQEAAVDFLGAWDWNDLVTKDRIIHSLNRVALQSHVRLRGAAAEGLVLFDHETYRPLLEEQFQQSIDYIIEHDITNLPELSNAQQIEHDFKTELCRVLANALIIADVLEAHPEAQYQDLDDIRDAHPETYKRAREYVQEAIKLRTTQATKNPR